LQKITQLTQIKYGKKFAPKINKKQIDLITSKSILREYDLCDSCLGRLLSKNTTLRSYNHLGKKIRKLLCKKPSVKCYICKNLFSNIQYYVKMMLNSASEYSFSTFLVGMILKPSIIDKDDSVKSKFKLQGIDNVKTEISRQIAREFAKQTRTKINYFVPDLTFTINIKNDSCEIRAKPLVLYGRYIKNIRGLSQKQKPCMHCFGKGCLSCNFYGISSFDSVEGKISLFLFKKFGATQAKINWIGGEDINSLTLGNGRPFFVKLLNPKKRKIKLNPKINLDGLVLKKMHMVDKIPQNAIQFRSKVKISVKTENKIKKNVLARLKSLKHKMISINEKPFKVHLKLVSDVHYRKNSDNSFQMEITVDGGFPIKRFVTGTSVNPNLNELLENKCYCTNFDFQKIQLMK